LYHFLSRETKLQKTASVISKAKVDYRREATSTLTHMASIAAMTWVRDELFIPIHSNLEIPSGQTSVYRTQNMELVLAGRYGG
jgi:hypothetical protein